MYEESGHSVSADREAERYTVTFWFPLFIFIQILDPNLWENDFTSIVCHLSSVRSVWVSSDIPELCLLGEF